MIPLFKDGVPLFYGGVPALGREDGLNPCCCGKKATPCSGNTLLFNPADYELHLEFYDGTYTDLCHNCDKIENQSFILPWQPTRFRWAYGSSTFGNACSLRRSIEIAAGIVCSGGKLGLRGAAGQFGTSSSASTIGSFIFWGNDSNAAICLWAGRWSTVNTSTCARGSELNLFFPDADVNIGQSYEMGALDIPCLDIGNCDCHATTAGIGVGPKMRATLVEA